MGTTAKRAYAAGVFVLVLAVGGQAEFQVNTYVQHNQTHAVVAMGEAGDFVVVWRSHIADGRGGGVYGRCFDANGTASGEEFKINRSAVDVGSWHPAVAVSPSGDFVVAWAAVRGAGSNIVGRMFDHQGLAIADEFSLSTAPDAVESAPSIAMSPEGGFVVVWTSWYEDGHLGKSYVCGCVCGPDGTPMAEGFLVDDRPQACWPDVAMDESGAFVITWIRMGDDYNRPYGEYIMFRRYRADGTAAGKTVQATNNLYGRWYGPSVAADASGAFVLTWAIGPFPYDICAQHFDSSAIPTTEAYVVNTCVQGNQGRPRIAGAGGQGYLVVWDSDKLDGMDCSVCGQFCMSDGKLPGGEFTLNTCPLGRQWYPDVAMAANGAYVVVWISEGQDGSGYGVFAEIGPQ